jgi:ABC-type antimicrobial peptide transport system ATPase subunit
MISPMSLVLEMAIKDAAREAVHKYLYNNPEAAPSGGYNDTVQKVETKRRTHKMSWMDFSDKELRIVNEIEKNPGMGGKQIVALMSTFDAEYPDGQCQEAMTKMLLANLVDRKVLISQGKQGYILNDSDTPPSKLPILPPA